MAECTIKVSVEQRVLYFVKIAEKRMAKATKKCNDTFRDYGFTFIERGDELFPQCVICCKILTNASMN